MGSEPDGPNPGAANEDDFDRQLRELTGNAGSAPRFREPSATERAARSARASRPRVRRDSRKARRLREPVPEPGRPVQRRPVQTRAVTRLRRGRMGRFSEALLRSRPVLVVALVLAALVATSIGLAYLSSH